MSRHRDQAIVFQPMGRRAAPAAGLSLLEQAQACGVMLESTCGGKGVCGKCKVRLQGPANPASEQEAKHLGDELAQGFRLACQAEVDGPAEVWVPESSRKRQQVILTYGAAAELSCDPPVQAVEIELPEVSLGRVTGLGDRIQEALERQLGDSERGGWDLPWPVLRTLGPEAGHGRARLEAVVHCRGRVLEVSPPGGAACLGLAVDLGTTTMVAYLHDLRTGRRLATQAAMNPQVSHGEDVISRISLCESHPEGLEQLAHQVRAGLSELARAACRQAGQDPSRIFEWVLVGNTAMHHIFLGLPPGPLARPPYAPMIAGAWLVPGRRLGLAGAGRAELYTLPVKAGFVGADTVAAALACGADRVEEPTLIVDLGTNGELVLATRQAMLCCSTAAGPAFEGGHITWGMRAAPGAVQRVIISPGDLEPELQVIGDVAPVGICGSGLVSLVSQLVAAGAVTESGGFDPARLGPRLRPGPQGLEYVLAFASDGGLERDLVLTHGDLAELQLAKAAIHAGVSIMIDELGVEAIARVKLAGAFGNYLDPAEACGIGLLPGVTPEMVQPVGNAAGDGAVMALLSRGERRRARRIAAELRYLELAAHPRFNQQYVAGMLFPAPGRA